MSISVSIRANRSSTRTALGRASKRPRRSARSAAGVRIRGSSARRVSQEKVTMKMSGEQRIAAARDKVWQALNDPDVLRRCIPGCQSLTKESDTRMVATVEIKIGPIGARFNGAVELADINAPDSYTLIMEGQAGTVGFVKSIVKVQLKDDPAGTLLSWEIGRAHV